ncbi:hypothetical protein BU25DRAFT_425616 [Macroventuria anomochaeta]|uniref:Uncharacterized protein n=1 Tax=Macroventuria anomochaeta TaxID=301207 RepID=A0ACB6RMQ1_9PLEO|nr:uncharacterized protein BU25DRAFT_425616 [Macroventuria anomochaeta]KAF2622439.1 hypothetical protein BU25DRAFT_425616 [Macroventuria anomochaeta]
MGYPECPSLTNTSSTPALASIKAFDPVFSFATSSTSVLETPKLSELPAYAVKFVEPVNAKDLSVTSQTSAGNFNSQTGAVSNLSMNETSVADLEDTEEAHNSHSSESLSSSINTVDDVEFLATSYPNIYAAALDRATDTLTSKLFAFVVQPLL